MRAIAPLLLATISLAGCSNPDQPPAAGADGAADAALPASVSYRCDDGTMLQVDYGDADASVRWADGRSASLPRAESASGGGADAYVGTGISLQRTSTGIEVHDGDAPALACTEVPADGDQASTGAEDNAGVTMRYACDADTEVTVLADGTARVALPDGQTVSVSRIAGSAPPVFSGQSLFFTVGEDGARLSQEGQANELACTAA